MDTMIVYQKWEDYAEYVLKCMVNQLPKSERYAMGTQIRQLVLKVGSHISRAQMIRDPRHKRYEVDQADLALNELKTIVRLADRLHYIDKKKFEMSVRYSSEIGRILGGWNKALSTQG